MAISNHRLLSLAEGRVTFRWRDSAHKNKKRRMSLTAEEFLRQFLLHLLPHRASCTSATSASSRINAEASYCHCAANC